MEERLFYPATCHPIGRRAFLAGALGAAAAAVIGMPKWARAGALEDSEPIILAHATRRDDPWAIVHGVRAKGREFKIEGGEPAVPFVLSHFLAEEVVNGKRHLAFPLAVEIHPNSFLKTFLEAGVPSNFRFTFKGKSRTLQEVIDGARALLRFSETTDRNTIAWSLIALTRTTPPARGIWTNAWGERVELARVVEAGFEAMEQASRPIQEARDRKVPLERQAPIHAFTCGGTHLLYSLLAATQAGYTESDHLQRVRRQMDLLVYRLWADVDMMTRYYTTMAGKIPGVGWYLLDAQIKFVGHAFECLHFAARQKLYAVPKANMPLYREAQALLDARVAQLRSVDLSVVKAQAFPLYQQLVGDTCHAYNGLRLAL